MHPRSTWARYKVLETRGTTIIFSRHALPATSEQEAAEMQSSALLVVLLAAAVVAIAGAYNDDRPIYKWSPLWFNSYLRRGVLHKRFNDDSPIYKWSPMWLDSTAARLQRLHYNKRGSCLDAGAECPLSGETSFCCSGFCHQGFCLSSAAAEKADYEYDR